MMTFEMRANKLHEERENERYAYLNGVIGRRLRDDDVEDVILRLMNCGWKRSEEKVEVMA